MQLLPIQTRRIAAGDDLVEIIGQFAAEPFETHDAMHRAPQGDGAIRASDILVISSKAVATAEGRIVDIGTLSPTLEAKELAEKCGRTPAFCQAVLEETAKRNGRVVGTCTGAIVTELRPWSGTSSQHGQGARATVQHDTMGTIITANAGLDESNVAEGTAVGWPEDPVQSAARLKRQLEKQIRTKDMGHGTWGFPSPKSHVPCPTLAIIISDSCCRPRRWGVTAYALCCSGIDPFRDEAGRNDLFGRPLRITKEAVADQLATAANAVMGNADQSIPAVIIRGHGIALSDFCGWVPGVSAEEDLFTGL